MLPVLGVRALRRRGLDEFTLRVAEELRRRFKIDQTTIQIEISEDADCLLEPGHAV